MFHGQEESSLYNIGMCAARTFSHLPSDDVISDAMLGACFAARDWETDGGRSFKSYAFEKARWTILDGIRARGHYSRSDAKLIREKDPETVLESRALMPVELDRYEYAPPVDDKAATASFSNVEVKMTWKTVFACLNERDRDIVIRRFIDRESQMSIGALYHITESRVCQLEKKALRRIRNAVPEADLRALVA